jgi:signal transduction histidine kinase
LALSEFKTYGWQFDPAAPHLFSDFAQIAFAFAISLWVGAMARQSLERRQLIDELERTRRELAAAEREEGILEERGRLAREIHDTLAQGFASIVAHLEAAKGSLDQDQARVGRHLEEAEDVARQSLADARGLAWALRPESLSSGGLAAAIERSLASTFRDSSVAASVTVTGPARALHPNVEVTLLRAAQEALANVRRHASAHEVSVTLSYFDDAVSLDIADDGVGFDPDRIAPGPSGGLGLLGIRERAEALGGSVAIESTRGHGTTIGINLPTQLETGAPTPAAEAVG